MPRVYWIKATIRVVLYLCLLALFISFYMKNQMSDFLQNRTTFTSRLEEMQSPYAPTATICVEPIQKISVAKTFGFSRYSDIFGRDVPNLTYIEKFEKLSYRLGKDYEIFNLDNNGKKITYGTSADFTVSPIFTLEFGLCTKIQPNGGLPQFPFLSRWNFQINPLLEDSDKPNKIIFFLTSNETWQGIVTNDWHRFHSSKIELDLQESWEYAFQLKVMEYKFQDGIQNIEECWMQSIIASECKVKCQHLNLTQTLPFCQTAEDISCILESAYIKNWYYKCNHVKNGLIFEGELSKHRKYTKENMTSLELIWLSKTREIREEIKVITTSNFIGSIGGSLGMFFGFSISTYALYFIDKCFDNAMKQN